MVSKTWDISRLRCPDCGRCQKEYEDDDACPWCLAKRREEERADYLRDKEKDDKATGDI